MLWIYFNMCETNSDDKIIITLDFNNGCAKLALAKCIEIYKNKFFR